jgi:hypothetical protein
MIDKTDLVENVGDVIPNFCFGQVGGGILDSENLQESATLPMDDNVLEDLPMPIHKAASLLLVCHC